MKKLSVTLILLLLGFWSKGQSNVSITPLRKSNPFVLGVTDSISSVQLSETRVLNIYLPEGYDKDTATYPVIYLLDGSADEDFIHIAGLVQFLTMIKVMPASIIIGIANVDRKRDFTFPTKNKTDLKNLPTTGGSAKFISFIEKDLEPYVQSHYHTNMQKTIIGQSLGGLLATEILLKKPALFNSYIIVSPSLWWDDESLLAAAPALLKSQPADDTKVYISVGAEGAQMENDAKKLVSLLQKAPNKKFQVHFAPLPEESHLTILHRSVYKAFEILNKKK